jgi:hypothetical protein
MRDLDGLRLELVGWIIDPIPQAFLWRSAVPGLLELRDQVARGSGEHSYRQRVAGGRLGSISTSSPTTVTETFAVLRELSLLMADETGLRHNRVDRFGYSYEVLYLTAASGFEYLDTSMFLFADVGFTNSGRCLGKKVTPLVYVLGHEGEVAVTHIYHFPNEDSGRSYETTNASYFSPIVPEYEADAALANWRDLTIAGRLSSRHACLVMRFIEEPGTSKEQIVATVPHIYRNWNPNKGPFGLWAEVKGPGDAHSLFMRLPSSESLEQKYAIIKADIEASRNT